MYDYLIVGAGLFGSICAYELNKRGYSCLVLEKRNHVGGNIYTENIEGINIHKYGPHIFHTNNKKIWDYINQFAEFNNFINEPIARYKDEIYNLPFNMNTFTKLWSDVHVPLEAKAKIQKEIDDSNIDEPKNLEEQAIKTVGFTIYEKLIKGYTEKQWGKSCKELPKEIIKRIPIRYIFDNNYFNDKYEGVPIGGYTQIIEKMLKGVDVKLGVNFMDEKDKYLPMAYKVIFTGSIDEFYDYRFGKLEYRSLHFEHELLDMENYQGVAVTNFTDKNIPYTRVIEHKHFEPQNSSNKTLITKEFPKKWTEKDERYYPINDDENTQKYRQYLELSSRGNKVIFGGRLGSYQYLDMDDIIVSALDLINKCA